MTTAFQHSYLRRILLVIAALWGQSGVCALLDRLDRAFPRWLAGSAVFRLFARDGAATRAWPGSITSAVMGGAANLPTALVRWIYRPCRKVLEGIHPDVTVVRDTEHRELTVDAVRALRQDVYIRPNEGERKVYLFTDCAQLNERDQNVLLKIVEEGPPYAAFVFCADTLHALLPTIRSRCVELRLDGGEEKPGEEEAAAALCRILAKRDALALTGHLTALENRRVKREQLLAMTEGAWQITAEALLAKCGKPGGCGDAAQALCRAFDRRQLQALTALFRRYAGECQYNVGAGHVLGALNAELIALLH